MQTQTQHMLQQTAQQISKAVTRTFNCEPCISSEGLEWKPKESDGMASAQLRVAEDASSYELKLILAVVPELANISICAAWKHAAAVIQESEHVAIPIAPIKVKDGSWGIGVKVSLQNLTMDLSRLRRLNHTLEVATATAKELQNVVPTQTNLVCPPIPPDLKKLMETYSRRSYPDSDTGTVTGSLLRNLEAGLPVALSGESLRVKLELDRLAQRTGSLATLMNAVPIPELPSIVKRAGDANLVLVAHVSKLRARMSLYEQGRDLDAVWHEMASARSPFILYGNRDELESQLGIGQGREFSPLYPVVETLQPATAEDLIHAAIAEGNAAVMPPQEAVAICARIQAITGEFGCGKGEKLFRPLANIAIKRGAHAPDLRKILTEQTKELARRRDTFGGLGEASAVERDDQLQKHLVESFSSSEFAASMRREVIGQDQAIQELSQRLLHEAICRPENEPIRVLQAGPPGTGKSFTAKLIASFVGWEHVYIDAASFDSPQSVMTSLAGSAPGIVNSYNDGVLAQYSRKPCVVEVADLDHAKDFLRGTLCDFFLRILQEGTLQTGSGRIVRTLPQVLFVFTSNIAFGVGDKVTSHFGFHNSALTRQQVRERVIDKMTKFLGPAFFSRVGEPVIFQEFTSPAATQIAVSEIKRVIKRFCEAEEVVVTDEATNKILEGLPNYEGGARRIIDEVRKRIAESLRSGTLGRGKRAVVKWENERILISNS